MNERLSLRDMTHMHGILLTIKNAVRETDFLLLFLCFAASAFGITAVYSATIPDIPEGGVISRDARTMLLAVGMGLVLALVISFVDYNIITKLYPLIGGVCILLMIAVLIWGKGPSERQDAKTWLAIGSSFYFQPSELFKIGFIITFGMHLELVSDKIKSFFHVLMLGLHGAVPILLVVISGDLGSALVFAIIFLVMMFCAGVQLRYFLIGAIGVAAAAPAIWFYVFDAIQKERFLGLLYPDRYEDIMYQQTKGMQAIRGGGLTGQGLFHGALTQAGTVPESENDMIFTVVGEELGLLGCAAALLLILAIIAKIMHTGYRSRFGATRLMCYGMAAMLAAQTIINVGMCLVIFPVVGITLPFFSAGGSSNLCVYIGIGLILSIYRFDKYKAANTYRLSDNTLF